MSPATRYQTGSEIPDVPAPPVTHETLRAYALASGDGNTIHLDDSAARAAGLPGVIAHGMLVAAWVSDRAAQTAQEINDEAVAAGKTNYVIASFSTRFKAMTFPGEAIQVGGRVKSLNDQECVLEISARSLGGEVKCAGVFRLRAAT